MFSGFGLKPPASGFQSYFYSSPKTSPSPFEDNGLLFWVPDVLCRHSEVVLWNSLYCGISSLCVGLYRWLVTVSWLGKLVSMFWWMELYFFSLECNEMSSNEL